MSAENDLVQMVYNDPAEMGSLLIKAIKKGNDRLAFALVEGLTRFNEVNGTVDEELDRNFKDFTIRRTASQFIAKQIFLNEDSTQLFNQEESPAASFLWFLARSENNNLKNDVIKDIRLLRGRLSPGMKYNDEQFTEKLMEAFEKISAIGTKQTSAVKRKV